MVCISCRFSEDYCHCQQLSHNPTPDHRYNTTKISQPYAISNSIHESYHSNTPEYYRSMASGPVGHSHKPVSTPQFQEPNFPYIHDYTPSSRTYGISAEQSYNPSFGSGAFAGTFDTNSNNFDWMEQNNLDHGPIQQSNASSVSSIKEEVSWSNLEDSEVPTSFNTANPPPISTSAYSLQGYLSEEHDVSTHWGQYTSQQNNTVASAPPNSSGAHHPLANEAQSSYATSYSYNYSQNPESSTIVTTKIAPVNLRNQNQYPQPDAMSGPDPDSKKCPHEKCRLGDTKAFTKFSEWQGHWYRTHEKRFACPDCSVLFGTDADVKRHLKAKHRDGPKEFICPVGCYNARSKEFQRKDRLKEHMDKWHGQYFCSIMNCPRGPGNGFKDQTLLDEHNRKYHGRRVSRSENIWEVQNN